MDSRIIETDRIFRHFKSLNTDFPYCNVEPCIDIGKRIYKNILSQNINLMHLPLLLEMFNREAARALGDGQYQNRGDIKSQTTLLFYEHTLSKWYLYIKELAATAKPILNQMKDDIAKTPWRRSNSYMMWSDGLPNGIEEVKSLLDKMNNENAISLFQTTYLIRNILERKTKEDWTSVTNILNSALMNFVQNTLTRDSTTIKFYETYLSQLPVFDWHRNDAFLKQASLGLTYK